MSTIDDQTMSPNTLLMANYLSRAASLATNVFTIGKEISNALYSNTGFRTSFNIFLSGPVLYYIDSRLGSIIDKFLPPWPSFFVMRFITTMIIVNRGKTVLSKLIRIKEDQEYAKNFCNILFTEIIPHIGGLLIYGEMINQDNLVIVREQVKNHFRSIINDE